MAPLRKSLFSFGNACIKVHAVQKEIGVGLKGTPLRWKSWYAFRGRLATTLYESGVPVETAALILRNSRQVCAQHYVRLDAEKQRQDAMGRLEKAFENAARFVQ